MAHLFANAWHTGAILPWDTETTGPNPQLDRIVTCTVAKLHNGLKSTRSWLIAPDVPISDGAAAVHGISNEYARANGRPAAEALAEIADELQAAINAGIPLLAFNAAFDTTILDRELTRHGLALDLSQALVLDPFVMWKQVDRYRKGRRNLTTACQAFDVRHDGAHDAAEDALAAGRVAWALAERYPDKLQIDLATLHAQQKAWKAEQASSLQAYFRRSGKPDAVVEPDWPLIPAPPGWSPEQLPVMAEQVA